MSKKNSNFAFVYTLLLLILMIIVLFMIYQNKIILKLNKDFDKNILNALKRNKNTTTEIFLYNYDNKLEKVSINTKTYSVSKYHDALLSLFTSSYDTNIYKSNISPSYIFKGITIDNNNAFINIEAVNNNDIRINEKAVAQIKNTLNNINKNLKFYYLVIGDYIEAI